MRTIRKCGGLDEYLLGDKPARIKELGIFGWRLRWLVLNSKSMKERFRNERANLGLPPAQQYPTFEKAWEKDPELREVVQKEQEKQWQEMREKEKRFREHVHSRWEPKDKTKYRPPKVVPEFDAETFQSIIPEEEAKEEAVQT
jgi:large subunit ribosomal protein L28